MLIVSRDKGDVNWCKPQKAQCSANVLYCLYLDLAMDEMRRGATEWIVTGAALSFRISAQLELRLEPDDIHCSRCSFFDRSFRCRAAARREEEV